MSPRILPRLPTFPLLALLGPMARLAHIAARRLGRHTRHRAGPVTPEPLPAPAAPTPSQPAPAARVTATPDPSPVATDDSTTTLDELLDEPPKSSTWRALSGVDVTPRAAAWLDELGARVEPDLLPITVTSGRRSPERQARALRDKLDAGETPQQLHALYQRDDLLDEVLAVADEGVEAMTEVLALQLARGEHLSPHMRDDAVDLRRRDRSTEQIRRLSAHCQALGAETVLERDHLHVQHLTPRPRA